MSEFSDGVTAPETPSNGETSGQETSTEKYLDKFVGEGKKYASLEEAAEALAKKAVHQDGFIETLKTEKQALESQYNESMSRQKSVEEILAAINANEPSRENNQPNESAQAVPSVDDIVAEVERKNREKELATKRKEAVDKAWGLLSSEDVFGDLEKAKTAVAAYIKGDENRKALVDQLAVADPNALVLALKQGQQAVQFSEDNSSQNGNESLTPNSGKLTWAICKQIRKDNPDVYYSKAFQNRMHQELPK